MDELTKLVLSLVDAAYAPWRWYGRERLTADARHALLDGLGVSVRVDRAGYLPDDCAYMLVPNRAGGSLLLVRSDLTLHQLRFVCALVVAEKVLGHRIPLYPPALVETACGVFAALGVAPAAERIALGAAWVDQVQADVRALGEEWAEARVAGLFRLAERVLEWMPLPDSAPSEAEGVEGVSPAMAAWEMGRRMREAGEPCRAAEWYRRAVRVGRASGEWAAVARGYIGLGGIAFTQKRVAKFRRLLARAHRIAAAHGCREEMGMACHDLMVFAARKRDTRRFRSFATQAMRGYGAGHRSMKTLAADVGAFYQLERRYGAALIVFEGLLQCSSRDEPAYLHLLANTSHVRAALGRAEASRAARADALRFLEEGSEEHASVALLTLAEGALFLGEVDVAAGLSTRALAIAEQRGESAWRSAAERFLARVATRATDAVTGKRADQGVPADTALARDVVALIASR